MKTSKIELFKRGGTICTSPINSQLIMYQTQDGQTKIDVRFDGDTVWLTQLEVAKLFQTTKNNISQHVSKVFAEGELNQGSTVKQFLTVQQEGERKMRRELEYYNLDLIISIGYRIKSKVATQFRIWATQRLREFIVKGFVLDDERLKNPDLPFDYFEELTQRIQDIRTSEKRFYRKITDIFALSVDYDPKSPESMQFFATVQNKMHWATSGETAAELIAHRVDADRPQMGLTNWRGTTVRKDEVLIAKNYLSQEELLILNNLVEQYLIFAQGQALRRTPMRMKNWLQKLDGFLQLNDREILQHAGKISHQLAVETATKEFQKFQQRRQQLSSSADKDFDQFVEQVASAKQAKRK